MNRRFALWSLSLLPVLLAQDFGAQRAMGDPMFLSASQKGDTESCRVRCTHFEGYIVVPRRAEASAHAIVNPDAELSVNRLYLPMNNEMTP